MHGSGDNWLLWCLNFVIYLGCVLLIPVGGLGIALFLVIQFLFKRWPFS